MLSQRKRVLTVAMAIGAASLAMPATSEVAVAAALSCPTNVYWDPPGDGLQLEYEYTYQYDRQESSPAAGCYYAPAAPTGVNWIMFTCGYPHYAAGTCDSSGCRES